MVKKSRSSIGVLLLTAIMWLALLSVSCRKNDVRQPQVVSDPEVVGAWLSLDLNVVSSGTATKVDPETEGGIVGNIDEDKITRLAIWLVPLESDREDWSKAIMTYIPDISLTSGSVYKASVRTRLNVPMHLYVGANISTKVASAFLDGGQDAVYASSSMNYSELIEEFASEKFGVSMFCTRCSSLEFELSNTDEDNPAQIDEDHDGVPENIDLVRMLSKVHVLFQCYPNTDYVKITEPGSMTEAQCGGFGWSRIDDISYILNTVNTSTKVFQQSYGGRYSAYVDANHSMSDILFKDQDWDYKADASGEFITTSDDLYAQWPDWAARPEKFNQYKEPFGSGSGRYVSGLYCLENTTDGDLLDLMTDDEKKYIPFKVATHLIVKARFVPRFINTVVGGVLQEVDYGQDGYQAALESLKEFKDDQGQVLCPAGTFFTRDMQEFYDYSGMQKLMELLPELSRKNFAEYPGGYGFYHSYIYGGTDDTTGQVTFAGTDSGVFRNHYHILNCSLMKVPATPGSFNQLMMVNSKVLEWNEKGKGEITVKPNV